MRLTQLTRFQATSPRRPVTLGASVAGSPAEPRRRASPLLSNATKRGIDVTVVVIALMLLLPLLLTLIATLLVSQGRPVIYRHRRIGRNGRSFHCFKFRTMVIDGDAVLQAYLARDPAARQEWEVTRKLKNDPRITPMGRILRRSSADELPQLFNILRNDMSLVGPRPIVPDEVRHYGARFVNYTRMKPGLTGLWQVSGRSDTSYAERVKLDADYAATQTVLGDLAIMVRTIPAVLRTRGSY